MLSVSVHYSKKVKVDTSLLDYLQPTFKGCFANGNGKCETFDRDLTLDVGAKKSHIPCLLC